MLRAAGWRVLTISSAASLPSAWAGAGQVEKTKPYLAHEHVNASDRPPTGGTVSGNGDAGAVPDEADRGSRNGRGGSP